MARAGGEVEGVLRMKYQSDLKNAEIELKQIQAITQSMTVIPPQLADEAVRVTEKIATLKEQIKTLPGPTKDAANGFENMGGILERMGLRIAVLYAFRESFQFMQELLKGAETLINFNEQLNLSINMLQVLQYGADQAAIPFTKVASAVDTLDKNLAQAKVGSVETLTLLGLGFEYILALNPDERFREIAIAIGSLNDPLSRTKAEIELFGTDAIDPIIRGYKDLAKAATDSGTIMDETTVRHTAIAGTAFKNLGLTLKKDVAEGYDYLITKYAEYMIRTAGIVETTQELDEQLKALHATTEATRRDNIELTSSTEDYEKVTRELLEVTKPLTQEQKNQLDAWHALGIETEKAAVKIGLTVEQYKAYEKELKEVEKSQRAANKAFEEMDKDWVQLMKTWDEAQKHLDDLHVKQFESEVKLAEDSDKLQLQMLDHREKQESASLERRINAHQVTQEQANQQEISNLSYYEGKKEQIYRDQLDNELSMLDAKQAKEQIAEQLRYNEGKEDYEHYQASVTAIDDTYENKRQGIEEKYRQEKKIREEDLAEKEIKINQQKLDKENAALARQVEEAAKIRAMGGSTTYDLSTPEGRAKVPEEIAQYLRAGYSFEQAMRLDYAMKMHFDVSRDPMFATKGPRVPGFKEGGTVMVGEEGPEVVRLPLGSTVFPHGQSASGGSVVLQPGAIVIQYPIMNDRQSMGALAEILSDAIVARSQNKGVRLGR